MYGKGHTRVLLEALPWKAEIPWGQSLPMLGIKGTRQ